MVSSKRSRTVHTQPPPLVRDGMSAAEAETLLHWLEAHGLCPSQMERVQDGLTVADYSRVIGVVL
jgi:hypothetical protein